MTSTVNYGQLRIDMCCSMDQNWSRSQKSFAVAGLQVLNIVPAGLHLVDDFKHFRHLLNAEMHSAFFFSCAC